jgi:hypothetical protein
LNRQHAGGKSFEARSNLQKVLGQAACSTKHLPWWLLFYLLLYILVATMSRDEIRGRFERQRDEARREMTDLRGEAAIYWQELTMVVGYVNQLRNSNCENPSVVTSKAAINGQVKTGH